MEGVVPASVLPANDFSVGAHPADTVLADTVLGVTSSLMQSRWVIQRIAQDEVDRAVRQYGLPEIVARLLKIRNVAHDLIPSFLNPSLSKDFPDPLRLAGMRELAAYLADAIESGRKLAVFGDFDVDGATSTAIMVRFLRAAGIEAPFYIPDRIVEGYGPNLPALVSLKEQGAEIVILCDCGITAHEVTGKASALGLEIVILDHHEPDETLPAAAHVINPKRRDDTSGLTMLAACGVTFLACVAVNKALREKGYYSARNIPEPALKDLLDLVALGTVCDMVPLTGANRLFVRKGFEAMQEGRTPGIQALCAVSRIEGEITPYHAGFVLGPRINAGSRVHQGDLGARLLTLNDAAEAQNIAWILNDCNDKRKSLQQEMTQHAVQMVEQGALYDKPLIVVGHESWHPGLSGLVAGFLKEKYGKPSVVIAYAQNDRGVLEGRGSGRSIPGIHLGAVFIEAKNAGHLEKGGGHAMAAGFTLLAGQEQAFGDFAEAHVARQMEGHQIMTDRQVDAVLSVRGASLELVRTLQTQFGPFGQDHEEPLFVLPKVRIYSADLIGQDHVRLLIGDWEGGSRMKAVAFRARGTPLGEALIGNAGRQLFHLAGHFKINRWNGSETVEFHVQDAALVY